MKFTLQSRNDIDGFLAVSKTLFQYDTSSSAWTEISVLCRGVIPSARHGLGFASYGEALYVFGGSAGMKLSPALNDAFQFDISSMTWTDLTHTITGSSPPPTVYPGFVSALDALFVWGGVDSNGRCIRRLRAFSFYMA